MSVWRETAQVLTALPLLLQQVKLSCDWLCFNWSEVVMALSCDHWHS